MSEPIAPKPLARHLPRRPQELIDGMLDMIALLKVSASSVSRDYYYGRAIAEIESAIEEIKDCMMSEV